MIDGVDRAAMSVRLRRMAGVSPAHKAKMDAHLESRSDWYTKCKTCGNRIEGLPQDIKVHMVKCNETGK